MNVLFRMLRISPAEIDLYLPIKNPSGSSVKKTIGSGCIINLRGDTNMAELFMQHDDWKKEKHMPVIDVPEVVKTGEAFPVKLSVGKEIPHPNTTEHHIDWIDLYFHPEGEKFPHQVGHFAFCAHGEAGTGPNTGPVYTEPSVIVMVKVSKPGVLHAMALCNIHGLWAAQAGVILG
jgi:superoxide reductase